MKERIKAIRWYQWLLMVAAGILGSVLLIEYMLPWDLATHISVSRAIEIFGHGESSGEYYTKQRLAALAGFLLLFIIGPALFFNYLLGDKELGDDAPPPKPLTSVSLWAGMILLTGGLIVFAGTSVVKPIVFSNTLERAETSKHKDQLRSELSTLALEAVNYLFTPEEYGGGSGSFAQFKLEELPAYNSLDATLYASAEAVSDTLLIIRGAGMAEGRNPDFENIGGQTGMKQFEVTVTPSNLVSMDEVN